MEKFVKTLVDYLIKENFLNKSKKKWAIYFFQKKILYFVNYLCFGIIAMLNNTIIETIIFIIVFTSLRRCTGGIHFNNALGCIIVSSLMVGCIPFGISTFYKYKKYVPLAISISFYIIYCFSPINHPNMHLTIEESVANHKKVITYLPIYFGVILITKIIGKDLWGISIVLAVFCVAITILLAKLFKQEEKNERKN